MNDELKALYQRVLQAESNMRSMQARLEALERRYEDLERDKTFLQARMINQECQAFQAH